MNPFVHHECANHCERFLTRHSILIPAYGASIWFFTDMVAKMDLVVLPVWSFDLWSTVVCWCCFLSCLVCFCCTTKHHQIMPKTYNHNHHQIITNSPPEHPQNIPTTSPQHPHNIPKISRKDQQNMTKTPREVDSQVCTNPQTSIKSEVTIRCLGRTPKVTALVFAIVAQSPKRGVNNYVPTYLRTYVPTYVPTYQTKFCSPIILRVALSRRQPLIVLRFRGIAENGGAPDIYVYGRRG